jgi:hypothetical protein
MADLLKIIELVRGGQLHIILVLLGLVSIFLAITGGIAGKIEVASSRQKLLALFGVIAFLCGISILIIPAIYDDTPVRPDNGGGGASSPITSTFKAYFESEDDFEKNFVKNVPVGSVDLTDGSLHLRCESEDPRKGVNCRTLRKFDNSSNYHFKVKLGRKRYEGHPTAHINFLSTEDLGTRFCLMIDEASLNSFTWINGRDVAPEKTFFRRDISKDRWHDVTAKMRDDKCEILIDGSHVKTYKLDKQLPSEGFFIFECHQEYWVEFLEIEDID